MLMMVVVMVVMMMMMMMMMMMIWIPSVRPSWSNLPAGDVHAVFDDEDGDDNDGMDLFSAANPADVHAVFDDEGGGDDGGDDDMDLFCAPRLK